MKKLKFREPILPRSHFYKANIMDITMVLRICLMYCLEVQGGTAVWTARSPCGWAEPGHQSQPMSDELKFKMVATASTGILERGGEELI